MNEDCLLRSLLDAFEEGACLMEGAALRCMNATAENLLGYRQQDLLGLPLLRELGAAAVLDRAPAQPHDAQLRRKDGVELDVICSLHTIGPESGGLALLKFRERKRLLDLTLGDIEKNLGTIFETISDGLIIIDERGAIQLFTPGAERLFGYRQDEALGRNVKILMPSPYEEAHDGYLSAYLETGVKKIIGVGREVSGRRKDGTIFPLYLSVGEMRLAGRRMFVGIAHDLTRSKRVEEERMILAAAVEQSPAAVMITTLDGTITYVNRSFSRLAGYASDEVVGQNARLLQSGSTAPDQYRRLWETIKSGREWRGEIQDRKKNGETYWALEAITPLRNAKNEIARYLAIQQDITEQKLDKEALAESEARFRQVADMAGEWLWEQDPEGRYTYSSGAVKDILGYAPTEIRDKPYIDLLTMEDRARWTEAVPFGSDRAKKPFHRLVNRYRHKNGREIYTESSGAPIFDERGDILKWRGVDHDITAQKAFEDALRIRDRAIEAASVGISITNAQAPGNRVVYANPALCRITGYSRDELIGRNLGLLRGPDTDPAAMEKIRQALGEGRGCEVLLKNYRKDGAAFWNELLISPVIDGEGKLTHYVGVQTDVTERLKAEESRHELEIARRIQLSLLPHAPVRLPNAEVAGLCAPASQVGGDYFDIFMENGSVDVVIADVSGHSVGAALIMTEVRSTLRAEARKPSVAPFGAAKILCDLNELLHDDLTRAELFITMFYVKFEPDTGLLRYANAGHNWAILLPSQDDRCVPLDAEGLVLGVRRSVVFEEKSAQLSVGDKLLLYTDGVTEAENYEGVFFGFERLCASFVANRNLEPETLVKQLLRELRSFCGDAPIRDDVSIVVIEMRGEGKRALSVELHAEAGHESASRPHEIM